MTHRMSWRANRIAANDDVRGADSITLGPDGQLRVVSVYRGPGSTSRITTKS
jgi:hypothetical protein